MELNDYKSNSHRAREEKAPEKKIEPVVKGKVTKKKNTVRKFTDTFIHDDVKNVKDYIIMDVLVPSIKKAISEMVTNGIDMLLYGETGKSGKRKSSGVSYVSYDRYSSRDRYSDRDRNRTRSGYSYDDIVIESRAEAEEVLDKMDDLIATYKVVSVADMYDLVGVQCEYTDNKYGWTNIRNAEVVRVRDGYVIKLPKALPID